MKVFVTNTTDFMVEFYDIDPMQIVWHGNYIKYFEKARCALLDKIGYNYIDMAASGFSFPVVDIRAKYMHSLSFHDKATIKANLVEYENCIKIEYEIFNKATGVLCTKGQSTQMCVKQDTQETQFILPRQFIDKVLKTIAKQNQK